MTRGRVSVAVSPQVSLQLGTTLNPDDIKEGDDVYFECHIRANPREHKIAWLHNVSNKRSGCPLVVALFFIWWVHLDIYLNTHKIILIGYDVMTVRAIWMAKPYKWVSDLVPTAACYKFSQLNVSFRWALKCQLLCFVYRYREKKIMEQKF